MDTYLLIGVVGLVVTAIIALQSFLDNYSARV
jgi:hypothetical protein